MEKLVVKNVGQILSGKPDEPIIETYFLITIDGKIDV